MSLKERIVEACKDLPASFKEEKEGVLSLEMKVAERKVFLSKKALMYRAKLRVDDDSRKVKFFETLKETGVGVSGGEDISPGFGFKAEKYKVMGKERVGGVEELSKLFGKDYKYEFDWSKVRGLVDREARKAGYVVEMVLNERAL
ncbi:MAG: ribonucleoside-triphosphate reductase [Candidatus Bathyarchaeia archaeon]